MSLLEETDISVKVQDPVTKKSKNKVTYRRTLSDQERQYIEANNAKDILNSNKLEDLQLKEKILFNKLYSKLLNQTITRIQGLRTLLIFLVVVKTCFIIAILKILLI